MRMFADSWKVAQNKTHISLVCMMCIFPEDVFNFVCFVVFQEVLVTLVHVGIFNEILIGQNQYWAADTLFNHFFVQREKPGVQ